MDSLKPYNTVHYLLTQKAMVVADRIAQFSKSLLKKDVSEAKLDAFLVSYACSLYDNDMATLSDCAKALKVSELEFLDILEKQGYEVPDDLRASVNDTQSLQELGSLAVL